MDNKLWTTDFILACLANFLMSFAFYLLIPILPLYLTSTLKLAESSMGVVLASYTLSSLVSRLFSGYLVDRFSRKKLLLLGLLLFTASFFGYIIVVSIAAFILLRIIHGITWGITSVSASTVAIDIIPSEKRGKGIGFYGLNVNLAMALAPWVAMAIYNGHGYTALIVCCLLVGCLALVVSYLIKIKSRPTKIDKSPVSLDRFILLPALPISFNLVLCAVAYGMIVSYGVLYGEEAGVKNAGSLFLFMGLGIGASRVISGRYVDRGYIHHAGMLSLSLLTVALIIFSRFHNEAIFYSVAFLCGVSFGTMMPVFQTLFVNMAHHNQRGTANSTYLTSFDLGIGGGMLLGGFVAQHANLSTAFLISAGLALIAIPYYYYISMPLYERKRME